MRDTISDSNLRSICAVMPMYNDEFTIECTVAKLVPILDSISPDYEIILVDDASPDESGSMADNMATFNNKIKVVHHEVNLGYGQALRDGFSAASKDFVFYTDGDGQYDVWDLNRAWEEVGEHTAVIGYREPRSDGLKRIFISKVYNLVCRLYLGCSVKDINCSFKIIPHQFFKDNKLYSKGGFIDAEMVCKLIRDGYKIVQIPVRHFKRPHGNSSFLKVNNIIHMLREMREFKRGVSDK